MPARMDGLVEGFDQINVLLHGVLAGRAFEPIPRVPLGAPYHVGEARFFFCVVAHAGLLVQRVDLEQRGVVGALCQVL